MSHKEEEEEGSEVEFEPESEPEKDETEEELEQLVFGDSAGFRERLKSFGQVAAEDSEDAQQTTGLEGLDDADVGQALSTLSLQGDMSLNMDSSSSRI